MTIRTSLAELHSHFNPDANDLPVIALRLEVEQNTTELPVHQHRKGQLVVARHGAVTCKVPRALWLVPPQHAVWIPGGMPHSNLSTHNARISYLFVEPDVIPMPEECCTLALTPLFANLSNMQQTRSRVIQSRASLHGRWPYCWNICRMRR